MAPEQLRGAPVDERCDVYALGATLYHLLARRPPHHAKTADEMMRAAVDGPAARRSRELVPGVPPELRDDRRQGARARSPTRATRTRGALAEDLQRFLTGQLVASHHYTTREKLLRLRAQEPRARDGRDRRDARARSSAASIAIERVVDERDRADAGRARRARAEAVAEAEQARRSIDGYRAADARRGARHRADDDPTRAVAMVQAAAAKTLWREARDVDRRGARARRRVQAAGIAAHAVARDEPRRHARCSRPATTASSASTISRTARRASVADVKRRCRRGSPTASARSSLFGGAQRHDRRRRDRRTRARSPRRRRSTRSRSRGRSRTGSIPRGALWKLDLAGSAPLQVAARRAGAARSRRRPTAAGSRSPASTHLLLLDRTQPALRRRRDDRRDARARRGRPTRATSARWSTTRSIDSRCEDSPTSCGGATSAGAPPSPRRSEQPLHDRADRRRRARRRSRIRERAGSYTLGLREARGGTDDRGRSARHAARDLADDGDHTLASPVGKLSQLARPRRVAVRRRGDRGRRCSCGTSTRSSRAPRRRRAAAPRSSAPTSVLATYVDAPGQSIDLANGKTHAARPRSPGSSRVSRPRPMASTRSSSTARITRG